MKSFTPLSAKELCEAEITAPAAPSATASQATAGVGTTPSVVTSTPSAASPATKAASSSGPDRRVSRPTTKRVAAEHASRGAPEGQHHLRREVEVRHPPHAVRPELQHPVSMPEPMREAEGLCEGGAAP